jgi:hypothetical protein
MIRTVYNTENVELANATITMDTGDESVDNVARVR